MFYSKFHLLVPHGLISSSYMGKYHHVTPVSMCNDLYLESPIFILHWYESALHYQFVLRSCFWWQKMLTE